MKRLGRVGVILAVVVPLACQRKSPEPPPKTPLDPSSPTAETAAEKPRTASDPTPSARPAESVRPREMSGPSVEPIAPRASTAAVDSGRTGILSSTPGMDRTLPRRSGKGTAFEDASERLGIYHRHRRGQFDPRLAPIMPWISAVGAAVAARDVDGDGDIDLYATTSRRGLPNALYLNQLHAATDSGGGARRVRALAFVESAAAAGIADLNDDDGVSVDAVLVDLDNDTDPDLYVAQWGKNRLFRNAGGGRFVEVTEEAGRGRSRQCE